MKTKEEHLLTFQKRYFWRRRFFTYFFTFFVPVLIGYYIGELISGKIVNFSETWFMAIAFSIGNTIVLSFIIMFTRQKSIEKEKTNIKEKIHNLQKDIFMLEKDLEYKKTTELEKESLEKVKKLYRLKNRCAKKEAYLHMLGG